MAHYNGVISAPIDVRGDIAQVLGENSGDVAVLCQSNSINAWSKVKPVQHGSKGVAPGAPVLQLMKEANYGFGGTEMFSNTDAEEAFEKYIDENGEWIYLKPDGLANNHPFRVLDFDGYNHNSAATRPVAIDGLVIEAHDSVPRQNCFTFTINSGASIGLLDFSFADWSSFDSIGDNNYKYAVMMRERGASGNPTIYYGINVFKLVNNQIEYNHRQGEGPNEIIYFDAPSGSGVYELVPCIIRHDNAQPSVHGNVIYLPAGGLFTYNGGPYLTQYCDSFANFTKQITRISSSAELIAGTGTMDIGLSFDIRILRINPNTQGDPYISIKVVTRSGPNTTVGGGIGFGLSPSAVLPLDYNVSKLFYLSNDNALRLPVAYPVAGVVTYWADFYDYGDNLLGSELLCTLV